MGVWGRAAGSFRGSTEGRDPLGERSSVQCKARQVLHKRGLSLHRSNENKFFVTRTFLVEVRLEPSQNVLKSSLIDETDSKIEADQNQIDTGAKIEEKRPEYVPRDYDAACV